jgi:hypothetical protein
MAVHPGFGGAERALEFATPFIYPDIFFFGRRHCWRDRPLS